MKRILTPKQRLFVHEYLVDMNATRAARRCGYSAKTARQQGQRLLTKAAIQKAIEAGQKKHEDKLEITAEKWLRELARIYFADVTNYLKRDPKTTMVLVRPFEEFPEGSSRAVEAIEEKVSLSEGRQLKVKLHSKLEAGKLIGQHLGYLKDRLDVPGLPELGQALYEISDRFLPSKGAAKTRSDEPK